MGGVVAVFDGVEVIGDLLRGELSQNTRIQVLANCFDGGWAGALLGVDRVLDWNSSADVGRILELLQACSTIELGNNVKIVIVLEEAV